MKFQLEVYQDMLHHKQQKHFTHLSHSRLHVRDKFTLSRMSCAIWLITHFIRNLEIVIKTTFKMLRRKV